MKILAFVFLILIVQKTTYVNCKTKRSIDLIAANNLIPDNRLPTEITPNVYELDLDPHIEDGIFMGCVQINMTWQEPANKIILHAHDNLVIDRDTICVTQYAPDDESRIDPSKGFEPIDLHVVKTEKVSKKPFFIIHLDKTLKRGSQCTVKMSFSGMLYNNTSEGLFRSSYVDSMTGEKKWFVASNFRPNLARRVFPCFDEPAYKVPFLISIVRPKTMTALSNMPVVSTDQVIDHPDSVRDHFNITPAMSTFALGFLISDFTNIAYNKTDQKSGTEIKIWARSDYINAIENSLEKIHAALKSLEEFWGLQFPLPKLDCVAVPTFQGTRPADNWGLIFFKESELSSKSTWQIAHEIVYQWIGALATPYWWSDAHVNNALARFVTTYTTLKISDGKETINNWPMTMLYSIYYEFSKRYPHGKVMAIKQDSTSTKTELIFRMLNYTLSEKTLVHGLQRFMADRQYKNFFSDDIWGALTEQAHHDETLDEKVSINNIAASWITKDRLPVLNITRNYKDNSAVLIQRVYLRERPHDAPEKDKILWWIPIVLIRQDKLNFTNATPLVWMKQERQIDIKDLPDSNNFIIVNPEEIGPFPVNYDTNNWNLLSQYLQTNENRLKIPVNTRAKLLHDAWNLAYAGDLNFATALNMTLFLTLEREHLAWDPFFTMIDHIGRHIESSQVHKKFLTYVRMLLTPLYEELEAQEEVEENEGIANLKSTVKVFLCQAGYKPCIEEAQQAFSKWMEAENPDEGNPVANQYICPVFKWGTKEEWEFGFQRIIKFPASRKQSERTYLLKTLAGCPVDSWKIQQLLDTAIFQQNGDLTDNDVYLIFSMLSGSSSGYTTLHNYLLDHWSEIRKVFENKHQLWTSLLSSSTSVFKTQEGLDMVKSLYDKKKGDFGPAEFIVEKAIKSIKEEAAWSTENLPVIEKWLDEYLKNNGKESDKNKFL